MLQTEAAWRKAIRFSGGSLAPSPRAAISGLSLLVLLASNLAQGAVTRIMPLGDSITVGIGDTGNGGYRGPLYQNLAGSGCGVDFVGSQTGGTIADPDHEGHGGWRADQIRDNISSWLTSNPADIVLLHIGTNDITQGEHAPGITAEIGQILNLIDAYESAYDMTITVVLSRIINRSNPLGTLGIETSALNASIASMAATRISGGDHLVVVDHESALSYPADLVDVVHPGASGYAKMSTVWFNALSPLLRNKGDLVADTVPTMMIPGISYDCSVTMQNSGCQAWLCSPTGTRLTVVQSDGPVAGKLISDPGFEIYTNPCQIDVAQDGTFPFTISVPADTPLGQYEISWQMRDNDEWFDSNGHNAVFRKTVAVRLYPPYRGDIDDDGNVDMSDFGRVQSCLSGSTVPQNDPSCIGARLDADSDVDQFDIEIFRGCLSGPNVLPASGCAM